MSTRAKGPRTNSRRHTDGIGLRPGPSPGRQIQPGASTDRSVQWRCTRYVTNFVSSGASPEELFNTKYMCLYPKLILNKKYIANKKNAGKPPDIKDPRTGYVPVGCGRCMECRNQKAKQWNIRLQEEIRDIKKGEAHFVTLTLSNQKFKELYDDIEDSITGYDRDNAIAKLATRRFLERWRKKYKKSVKHWFITEIGKGYQPTDNLKLQGDGNIHLHGIIFTKHKEDIEPIWQYGYIYIGDYVDESTVQYCVKYMTKLDPHHKEYIPRVLTSPGMGAGYVKRQDAKNNKYTKGQTDETYTTRTGAKLNLPIYYRNKIYTEEEREKLWIEKLNKEERYVLGTKISTKESPEAYYRSLKHARKQNKKLGYGDDATNWNQKEYEELRRKINHQKRIDNSE